MDFSFSSAAVGKLVTENPAQDFMEVDVYLHNP